MRTTSIKETLEKHSQPRIENVEEQRAVSPTSFSVGQRPANEENVGQHPTNENIETIETQQITPTITETNTVPLSKECWDECVRNSCGTSKMAEIILLKVNPSPTDNYQIELEVASELEKNEIKQIQSPFLQQLHEKTGNLYLLEIQVIKVIRERMVDKSNPDEKFIHLCKENPHLLEFKQRLNLSIS